MSFRDLDIKKFYDSDSDDILNKFYIPVLAETVKYKRLAGFFSSTSLAIAAKGIVGLIGNRGKMELVCSARLSRDDVHAIMESTRNPSEVIEKYIIKDIESLEKLENEFILDHVKALGWMIANGLLEIKVAILKDKKEMPLDREQVVQAGIFHQKVGVLYDKDGNVISFSGSDNESASAWIKNIEEFKVFFSWDEGTKNYLKADCNKFEKFWNGDGSRVEVIDIPQAVKNKLLEITPDHIEGLEKKLLHYAGQERKKELKLWAHQTEAIDKWLMNGKRCIFEMATGTGKTLTALGCVKELFKKEEKIVTVISCPYNHLITQWKDNIDKFGITDDSIIADSSNPKWKHKLTDSIIDINNNVKNRLTILTSHDSFYRKDFIEIIRKVESKLFLIGDEVHGMASEERKVGLLDKYDYRLGLSATPSRWMDPDGTKELYAYFNVKTDSDIYKFPIEKAIKTINPATGKTYLTPYDYFPYFVGLTNDEIDQYIEESRKIVRQYHISKSNVDRLKYFNLLCIKRQEIVKNASNKLHTFEQILGTIKDLKHCLVYCSPSQLDKVQDMLIARDIVQHKFTQHEGTARLEKYGGTSERDYILDKFSKGIFKILVAMQCLDEGVDIPQAEIGIILASSGNPRQYIQRRGRILRRFQDKEKASVYDILVFPSLNRKMPEEFIDLEKRIVAREFIRYFEFARSADNVLDCLKQVQDKEKEILG